MSAKRMTALVALICAATGAVYLAAMGNAYASSRMPAVTPRNVAQPATPSIRGDKADMKTGVANITKKAISN